MFAVVTICILLTAIGVALCKAAGDSSRQEEYWWMHHPDDDDGISIVTNIV